MYLDITDNWALWINNESKTKKRFNKYSFFIFKIFEFKVFSLFIIVFGKYKDNGVLECRIFCSGAMCLPTRK